MRYDGEYEQSVTIRFRMSSHITLIPSPLQSKSDNSNMVMVPVAEVDPDVEGSRRRRSIGPENPSLIMVDS